MGLSGGERYSKIAYAINALTKIENVQNATLRKYIKSLWYHFLKNQNKGLFSDDFDINIEEGTSLVKVAMLNHVPKEKHDCAYDDNYSYFEYYDTASRMLDMQRIISNSDKNAGDVLLIYNWTESIIYALCRYNDDFKDDCKSLHFVVRQIQGECFDNFKCNRVYTAGWMLANLADKILTFKEDIVNKWWMKHHLHHNIQIKNLEYDKLFNLYKRFQFKELSIEKRIILTLRLMGKKYHCEHQHKEFLEMIKDVKIHKEIGKYLSTVKAEKYRADIKYCEFTGNYKERDENG